MGILYLVATPIGNLEDITLRALRILKEVALIAAEDTRHTKTLLRRYQIATPLTSYHQFNKLQKLGELLSELKTKDIALVSDAGTPGFSDPGYELVREALRQGFSVVPIPGPSAAVAALVASGLGTSQFTYLGFLPRKKGERARLIESLRAEKRTLVFFEAPHRLVSTLEALAAALGDREVVVARELTKVHEEFFRGTLSAALVHFRQVSPRGEIVLIIEGAKEKSAEVEEEDIVDALKPYLASCSSAKEATAAVAEKLGIPRRRVYRIWQGMKRGSDEKGLISKSEQPTETGSGFHS